MHSITREQYCQKVFDNADFIAGNNPESFADPGRGLCYKSVSECFLNCVICRLGFALAVNQTPARFNGAVGLTAYITAVAVFPAVNAHADNIIKLAYFRDNACKEFSLTLGSVLKSVKTCSLRKLAVKVI